MGKCLIESTLWKRIKSRHSPCKGGMRAANSSITGMTLASFTSLALIKTSLRGGDAASVIQELSLALQREKYVVDLLPFYHTALNAEFLVSSEVEAGLAFPHARLPGLKKPGFAVGRSDQPLLWGSKGSRSVRLVFLIAVPATDSTQYLLLLSGLARLSKNRSLVERLI